MSRFIDFLKYDYVAIRTLIYFAREIESVKRSEQIEGYDETS